MPKDVYEQTLERRRRLGANLKARRAEAGLTQERVVLDADIYLSFYVDVENGHHSLAVDRLFAIADAFDVRVADLMKGID